MEYITSIVPETIRVLGPEEGGHLAGAAARLVGMHTFDEVAALLGGVEAGAAGFAMAFARLSRGQDDDAELHLEGLRASVRQTSWRLMAERRGAFACGVRRLERIVDRSRAGARSLHARRGDGTSRSRRRSLVLAIQLGIQGGL